MVICNGHLDLELGYEEERTILAGQADADARDHEALTGGRMRLPSQCRTGR
jgi:hypothetical protein